MYLNAFKLEESWRIRLASELKLDYLANLKTFLNAQSEQGCEIYPAKENVFLAMEAVPFDQVKVVILGQDPYHGPDQAHGLSFSVPEGIKLPPSLRNIYKELYNDLGFEPPCSGDLSAWARQGVLLLNSVLTVERGRAGAHQGKGWETFTSKIIEILNEEREGLVFILWGAYAHKKGALIDRNKHCVLSSAHPSPLSAYRGFLGSSPFSKANDYFVANNVKPIEWV